MGEVCYGQWCYHSKFIKGIRLHWLLYAGFGEIRFLKWRGVINSSSWFLAILKGISEDLHLVKLYDIFFPLKIKKGFN